MTAILGMALSVSGALSQASAAQAASTDGKTSFIASLVSAAQSTQRKFGVPASVSIAQAIEASDWGASAVVKKAKNYFDTPCSGLMTKDQYAKLADAQVGKPYVLGANGPKAFDCSSLVIWVNNQSGAYRMGDDTAAGLYNRGKAVSGSPAVGDMVFLRNNPARANGIGHTAVLTKKLSNGDWRIIEARGRAYGVVRTTLSYWKKRSYYAGLRRLPKISFASTASATASAARLYQSGCIKIGSAQYAKFTSMTNSFYANAAAITSDAAYKSARSVMTSVPAFVDALAKVVKPKDPASYARAIKSLIDTYDLTNYDIVPIGLVLTYGNSGAKVTALQYLLQAAGYTTSATGTYDSATVSAVKKLQKAKKLEVDGEAGQYTLSALFAKLSSGASGPRVSALHALLGSLDYITSGGDSFGAATLAAVKSFQTTSGRSPAGSVDKQTWAALFMTLNTSRPTVSGSSEVGQTLQASAGNWGPGPISLSYQWYRGSTAIGGATANSYAVQPADAGATLKVVVTGIKTGYTATSRPSSGTQPIRTASLTATPTPRITGTPRVGETLTATTGTWAPGDVSLTYQWYRDGEPIKSAAMVRYLVQPADAGEALTVTVTGSKAGYTTATKTSAATTAVAKASLATVATPKISGSRKVGKTLTAVAGEWKPGPVTYAYQWYRGSTRISGATGKTYTTHSKDRNKTLYVTVTGSRDGYRAAVKKSTGAKIA